MTDLSTGFTVLAVVFALMFAWLASSMASKQGRDAAAWLLLGATFGIFAVGVLLLAGRHDTRLQAAMASTGPRLTYTACPKCESAQIDSADDQYWCYKCDHLWSAAPLSYAPLSAVPLSHAPLSAARLS